MKVGEAHMGHMTQRRCGMLWDRAMLKMAELAARDHSSCTGVLVEPGAVVATNRHILARLEAGPLPEEEFPVTGAVRTPPGDFKPFTLEPAGLRVVTKSLMKSKTLPILNVARMDEAEGDKVTFEVTDLENPRTVVVRKTDTTFPKWELYIPKREPKLRIALDVDLLVKLVGVARLAGGGDRGDLILEFTKPDEVVGVRRGGCPRFVGAIMPMTIAEGE